MPPSITVEYYTEYIVDVESHGHLLSIKIDAELMIGNYRSVFCGETDT